MQILNSTRDGDLCNTSGDRPVQRWRLLQAKLRRQVTLPVLIGLIQLGIALAAIVSRQEGPEVLLWLLPALVIGLCFGHATRVVWDDDTTQLVLVGGQLVLTLAWVATQVGSKTVLTHALNGMSSGSVIAQVVACGLVVGHSLGLLSQIHEALTER